RREDDGIPGSVQEDQESIIPNRLAVGLPNVQRPATEQDAKNLCPALTPIGIGHLVTIGPQPLNVLDFAPADLPSLEELGAPQAWVFVAQSHESPGEVE